MFILVFVTLSFFVFVFVFVAVKLMNRNGDFCWPVEWHLRTNSQTLPRAGWPISPGLRWCDVQRYQPLKESYNILLNTWVLEAFCCFTTRILHVPNLTTQTDMVILESLKSYIAKSSWFKPFIRSVFKDHSARFTLTQEMQRNSLDSLTWFTLGHFRVAFCLCVKTNPRAKPFIWKCVPFTGSFLCKSKSSSYDSFCTRTRFETEKQGGLCKKKYGNNV